MISDKETVKTEGTPSARGSRGPLRIIRGRVVSASSDKTRVIAVERRIRHGKYLKSVIKQAHIFVHDEKNQSKLGDLIDASSCRPLSKNKSFRLKQIVAKGEAQ